MKAEETRMEEKCKDLELEELYRMILSKYIKRINKFKKKTKRDIKIIIIILCRLLRRLGSLYHNSYSDLQQIHHPVSSVKPTNSHQFTAICHVVIDSNHLSRYRREFNRSASPFFVSP